MSDERKAFQVFRDGKLYVDPTTGEEVPPMTHNECFAFILHHQPMSVEWAMKYEGWSIRDCCSADDPA